MSSEFIGSKALDHSKLLNTRFPVQSSGDFTSNGKTEMKADLAQYLEFVAFSLCGH